MATTDPKVLAQVERMFVGLVPHNDALGLRVRHFGQGRATTVLPWAARLVGDPRTGVLHGGAVTSVVDATCGAAVFAALRAPVPIATLDLRIDYHRAARSQAEVCCEATCDRVTRHVGFTRATAHDGDPRDPIATAAGTFVIASSRSERSAVPVRVPVPMPAVPDMPVPVPDVPDLSAPDLAAAIARARAGDIAPLAAAIPYARFLGLTGETREGTRTTKLAYSPANIGNASLPALHGGTLGALLESAALFEVLATPRSTQDGDVLPRTISLTVQYLRSGRPVDTFARAEVVRAGRRVVTLQARAWQDDPALPVATAQVHALVVP